MPMMAAKKPGPRKATRKVEVCCSRCGLRFETSRLRANEDEVCGGCATWWDIETDRWIDPE